MDTIFALSSGAGRAGVAVFRISGPRAFAVGAAVGVAALEPRRATFVRVRGADGATIDEGLALAFPAPSSFTGEDVLELHLHGSRAVAAALSEALTAAGARPAEAGEFTRRAFAEGKLDLAQSEGLGDLIDADTELQRRQALGQLGGRLSEIADGWRDQLVAALAPLEAAVDFPDEADVPADIAARAAPVLAALKADLSRELDRAGKGEAIREGATVALVGAVNAGKSSLLNRLSGLDAAIVSDAPGTTRDVVEVRLDLGGMAVALADTAGLRAGAADPVEIEGIRRTRARSDAALLRIGVVDGAEGPDMTEDFLALLRPGDLVVFNKSDLSSGAAGSSREGPAGRPEYAGVTTLDVSARTGAGIDALLAAIETAVAERIGAAEAPAFTRARHRAAAAEALAALERAEAALERGPELAAEDLRLAARALGRITGAVDVEDVLDAIFSAFCIGK